MRRIEAIADSLAELNSYHDPESEAYRLRNPGRLRLWKIGGELRSYTHHIAGYQALLFILKRQCEIHESSTLRHLLEMHEHGSDTEVEDAVVFIRKALGDKKITPETRLSHFAGERMTTAQGDKTISANTKLESFLTE